MINKISFKNYKAFDEGEIKIKPITILIGANSSGKSSIMQLLLMLQQTALAEESYNSALKLNGGSISLGENVNLFRKKDTSKDISISIEYDNTTDKSEKLIEELINDILFQKFQNPNGKVQTKDINFLANQLVSLNSSKSTENLIKILDDVIKSYKSANKKKKYVLTRDLILEYLKVREISITYSIKSTNNIIWVNKIEIWGDKNKEILSIELDKKKITSIKSDLINTSDLTTIKSLKKTINNKKTIFSLVKKEIIEDNNSILTKYIQKIILSITKKTKEYFDGDKINYISPLRAHPKRYYFLDKAKINIYIDTLDGDSIAETLKENETIKEEVNKWLKKFGLKIEVSHLKDIIHKLVINQNALDLDITDVGFGISQILPVIIQGLLSHKNSLTLIEQPEIHLHPKMQADLADLFIEIVSNNPKYLLIETHSEYLLKRLRRRMSEGVISPEKVGIYLIDPQKEKQGAKIKELKIGEKGGFKWPSDFYTGELLDDTVEFLKNQQ